jgi:transcriptional regulator with XRE-family HTH domain
MDDFGQLVKHKRKGKGLSTRELSRQVGMSSAYISQLERGLVKRPDYDVAKRIADVLGIEESVLDYFGFVPDEVERQMQVEIERELEHRRELKAAYISNLSEQLQTMDLESLETTSFILNQQMDVARKLYEISLIGDRQAMVTIKEFIDFMHSKHVVVD